MQDIIAAASPLDQLSFGSPAEAIEAAKRNAACQRSGPAGACEGRTIERVLWTDAAVRLILQGGSTFEIACGGDGVIDYKVYDAPPETFGGDHWLEDVVSVRFPHERYAWHRREIIMRTVGRTVKTIVMKQNHLLLYVADIDIILFSGLLDVAARRYFLFWSPTE